MKYQHGSRAAYVIDHCRCFGCHVANADYEWRRYTGRLEDRWHRDMQPIRNHIAQLRAAGYSTRTIADIANINRNQIMHILGKRGSRPPATRILKTVAAAILAIDIPTSSGIDQIAIQRHYDGDHTPPLTYTERLELIRRWKAAGRPLTHLQQATGWNVWWYARRLDRDLEEAS